MFSGAGPAVDGVFFIQNDAQHVHSCAKRGVSNIMIQLVRRFARFRAVAKNCVFTCEVPTYKDTRCRFGSKSTTVYSRLHPIRANTAQHRRWRFEKSGSRGLLSRRQAGHVDPEIHDSICMYVHAHFSLSASSTQLRTGLFCSLPD